MISLEKSVSEPFSSCSTIEIKLRSDWLSACVSSMQGSEPNCRKSGIMRLVSMLMRLRKSGAMTIRWALKWLLDCTCRMCLGLKMKSESFLSRNSCRFDVSEVSPSVPTPIMRAFRRLGNRNISISDALFAAMHSPIIPGRFSPPAIVMSSFRVKLDIGISEFVWFIVSLKFRQI